jgi:large subunit ribosomal protein L32
VPFTRSSSTDTSTSWASNRACSSSSCALCRSMATLQSRAEVASKPPCLVQLTTNPPSSPIDVFQAAPEGAEAGVDSACSSLASRPCNRPGDSDNGRSFASRAFFRDRGEWVVGVPKRRKSKSAKGHRRSHDALTAPALNVCPQCKQSFPPHLVCDQVEECGNVQRSKTHTPKAKQKA